MFLYEKKKRDNHSWNLLEYRTITNTPTPGKAFRVSVVKHSRQYGRV